MVKHYLAFTEYYDFRNSLLHLMQHPPPSSVYVTISKRINHTSKQLTFLLYSNMVLVLTQVTRNCSILTRSWMGVWYSTSLIYYLLLKVWLIDLKKKSPTELSLPVSLCSNWWKTIRKAKLNIVTHSLWRYLWNCIYCGYHPLLQHCIVNADDNLGSYFLSPTW